jgi:MarR family transcriptional regulator for hemolysin
MSNAIISSGPRYDVAMSKPVRPAIGRFLGAAAKDVSRAFEEALTAAGGSLPMWLVLMTIKSRKVANQRELAEEVGIQGPTLTHHLNAMEERGLLTRHRDPANRRVHMVELTDTGEKLFAELAMAAAAFDRHLRKGITDSEVELLRGLLERLRANVFPAD